MKTSYIPKTIFAAAAAFAASTAFAGEAKVSGFTNSVVTEDYVNNFAPGKGWGDNILLAEKDMSFELYADYTFQSTNTGATDMGLGFSIKENATATIGSADGKRAGHLTFKPAEGGIGCSVNINSGAVITVNKNSSLIFESGANSWGNNIWEHWIQGTMNVYGTMDIGSLRIPGKTQYSSFYSGTQLNVYAGSIVGFDNIQLRNNSSINFYGQAKKVDFRAVNGAVTGLNLMGGSIGLYGRNALKNYKGTSWNLGSSQNVTINVGDSENAAVSQVLPEIVIGASASMTVNFAGEASGTFFIEKLSTSATGGESSLIFNNFYNDFVCFGSDFTLDEDAIVFESGFAIILSATDISGQDIEGEWYKVEKNGKFYLNNTGATPAPVPEPATYAAIFGAIALFFAFRRRK